MIFRIFFLILPIIYFPILIDPVLIPRQIFLNFFLVVLIVIIMIHSKEFMIDRRFFSQRLFAVCVGWLLANFFSGILCINAAEWISGFSKYFLYILFFLLLSVFILSDKIDTQELTKSIILFSGVTVVMALVQIFSLLFTSPGIIWHNMNSISSTIANKNLLSSCLFLTFPFLLSADTINRSWKRFAIILFITELVVILMIQTKTVWIACIAFFLVLFFHRKKIQRVEKKGERKKMSILTFLLLLFVSLVVAIYAMDYFDSQLAQRLFAYAYDFHTANTRFLLWQNTLDIIKEHFLFGVGTNNWQIWFPHEGLSRFNDAVANGLSTYQRPHNDFLWVFSETGIIGFLFYVMIFLAGIRYCFRMVRNSNDEISRRNYILFIATIIGYAIISFVDFPLERIEHNLIFFTILSIIATDYLRRFNYTGKKRLIKKNLTITLVTISAFTLVVSCCRFTGEYYSHRLISAHLNSDWKKMIDEKNRAGNIFYNMDFFSTPLAWYSGVAYYNRGDLQHATVDFETADRVHPNNIHVLNNLATCYEKNNRHYEAIEFYKRALSISPEFRESLVNLSGAYYNSGEFENAYQTISKCSLDTTDGKYMNFLKAILQKKDITPEKFISLKRQS